MAAVTQNGFTLPVLLRKQEPRVTNAIASDSGLLLSQEHGSHEGGGDMA